MPSGGARNRSGPPSDPNSYRSAAKGLSFSSLPADGYQGDVPEHPGGAEGRTLEVWRELWRTPQAAAWASQAWRWSHIADLARLMVLAEDPETPVGVYTHLRQARADLGLTPAGLIENGWRIGEAAEYDESHSAPVARQTSSGDWLKAVSVEGA